MNQGGLAAMCLAFSALDTHIYYLHGELTKDLIAAVVFGVAGMILSFWPRG